MDNNELYHSDVYLGEDYSDGIKHYKYIRREKKPNGGYKYYYKKTVESDKLFSRTLETTGSNGASNNEYIYTTNYEGKLDRGLKKVKNTLNKISNNKLNGLKNFINKGKEKLSKLFSKAITTSRTTKVYSMNNLPDDVAKAISKSKK